MSTDIAEFRRLDAEATPGPWKTDLDMFDESEGIAATVFDEGVTTLGIFATDLPHTMENWERAKTHQAAKNTALIVALRNNLPGLLDKLERLRDQVVALNEDNMAYAKERQKWILDRPRLEYELERLRSENDGMAEGFKDLVDANELLRRQYLEVADALLPESNGTADLVTEARRLRAENEALRMELLTVHAHDTEKGTCFCGAPSGYESGWCGHCGTQGAEMVAGLREDLRLTHEANCEFAANTPARQEDERDRELERLRRLADAVVKKAELAERRRQMAEEGSIASEDRENLEALGGHAEGGGEGARRRALGRARPRHRGHTRDDGTGRISPSHRREGDRMTKTKNLIRRAGVSVKNTSTMARTPAREAWFYEHPGSIEVYIRPRVSVGEIVSCRIPRKLLADWIKRTARKDPP